MSTETPKMVASAVAIALTIMKACAIEGARERVGHSRGLRIACLGRAGTLVWRDPSTGEERYSAPGDPMYSTALMLADEVIGEDGQRVPWS